MLRYLIIQLCDSAPSFCYYSNKKKNRRLLPLDVLEEGILFGMKQNLNIQFIYPDYELSENYKKIIETIDHTDIVSSNNNDLELKRKAEVIIFDTIQDLTIYNLKTKSCILRTNRKDFFNNCPLLLKILHSINRFNIVFTDIQNFENDDFDRYKSILNEISDEITHLYIKGFYPQTNILTDRIILNSMNNCNAGEESISLMPDGKFYFCPAFYMDELSDIGSPEKTIKIFNQNLLKIKYAPICRKCDAFHCKRCIWLNQKQTLEINTPGHEQCVISHLERNESRNLLAKVRQYGVFMPDVEINEINYLDPFDIYNH